MASYSDGTVFSSAKVFQPKTDFGKGCVFPRGCTFLNPCYFGDGCVFAGGCNLTRFDRKKPPHETGDGCVFGPGCSITHTRIGSANVIESPSLYQPISEGSNTVVNGSGTAWPSSTTTAEQCSTACGQVVSGTNVSKDWCQASNLKGFDAPGATVEHPSICE